MIHGFTAQNWKARLVRFPLEDSFKISNGGRTIAVADGVTMDCKNGKPVSASVSGAWNTFWHYPRPSYAKMIADDFAGNSWCYYRYPNHTQADLRRHFGDVNLSIKIDNEVYRKVDYNNLTYLERYPSGCTGSVAIENRGEVLWGYITDCGIAIISPKGDLRVRTPDEGPDGQGKMSDYGEEVNAIGGWQSREGRALVRKKFRNNPSEPRAYGILNGMPEAMHYVRTGTFQRDFWDYLLVYSDGIADILFKEDGDIDSQFADTIRRDDLNELENLCDKKVRTEGTLVIKR